MSPSSEIRSQGFLGNKVVQHEPRGGNCSSEVGLAEIGGVCGLRANRSDVS